MQNWKKTYHYANFNVFPYVIDGRSTAANQEDKTENEKAKESQKILSLDKKDLLLKYGNTLSLIDATHKPCTKYKIPLFFVCTNVGYSELEEFIPHQKLEGTFLNDYSSYMYVAGIQNGLYLTLDSGCVITRMPR